MPLPPEVAMRRVVAMLVLPLASLAGQQQPQQLGIHYEHSSQYEANEVDLPKAIRQLGESIRLRIRSGAAPRLAGVRDTTFEYSTPCDSIKPPAIVVSSPAKFIDCQRKLSGAAALTPIFIMRKYGMIRPYYSALIVARKDAPFDTFEESRIKSFYLADPTSTSGYVMPLHMLWSRGIIGKPTLEGANDHFGSRIQVRGTADPRGVEEKVSHDAAAVGAIGEYRTREEEAARLDKEGLKVILRYELIPQGVIAITSDLIDDRSAIEAEINTFFRADSLAPAETFHLADPNARIVARSSLGTSGVEPFGGEYRNAYENLAHVFDLVTGVATVGQLNTESATLSRAFQVAVGVVVLGVLYIAALLTLRFKRNARGEGAPRSDTTVYVAALALSATWFYLISHPGWLRDWSFFLIIVVSAGFGTAFRAIFRASVPTTQRRTVVQEAAAGLILAVVFSLIFFLTEDLVHQKNPFPVADLDLPRYAITIAVLSVSVAVLLDEAAVSVIRKFRERVRSVAGEPGNP